MDSFGDYKFFKVLIPIYKKKDEILHIKAVEGSQYFMLLAKTSLGEVLPIYHTKLEIYQFNENSDSIIKSFSFHEKYRTFNYFESRDFYRIFLASNDKLGVWYLKKDMSQKIKPMSFEIQSENKCILIFPHIFLAVLCGDDGRISIFDIVQNTLLNKMTVGSSEFKPPYLYCENKEGKMAIAAQIDCIVAIYKFDSTIKCFSKIKSFKIGGDCISSIVFPSFFDCIVAGKCCGDVHFYHLESDIDIMLKQHSKKVFCIQNVNDEDIVSLSVDGFVVKWEWKNAILSTLKSYLDFYKLDNKGDNRNSFDDATCFICKENFENDSLELHINISLENFKGKLGIHKSCAQENIFNKRVTKNVEHQDDFRAAVFDKDKKTFYLF